jgi:hypothetical protein
MFGVWQRIDAFHIGVIDEQIIEALAPEPGLQLLRQLVILAGVAQKLSPLRSLGALFVRPTRGRPRQGHSATDSAHCFSSKYGSHHQSQDSSLPDARPMKHFTGARVGRGRPRALSQPITSVAGRLGGQKARKS